MDSKLSAKVVSLFLVASVCLLGYVAMSSFGEPSLIPGKVGVDSRVQFKQNDNVSYYFAQDSYVDRLEIAPAYFKVNSLKFTTSVSTGNVNVTLYDADAQDGYLKWRAEQDVANAGVTFNLEGLLSSTMYDWFIDGAVVAHTVCDGAGVAQYTYSGPWSSHVFVVQRASGAPHSGLQASFEYTMDGNLLTFTDKSFGPVTMWIWNFGDDTGSTKQSPTHKYTASGKYVVSLTVYDSDSHSSKASVEITLELGPDFPVERTEGGWDVFITNDLTLSISAVGLLVGGAIMYVSAMYLRYFPVITPKGRKLIGFLMVIAGLYFLIFIDASWMKF